ncbi:transcriptional repressor [Candidatus Uhrbacteria bacterium]|nr:transcriptional repressor [Candidatus Uhrbacteria bacterium]
MTGRNTKTKRALLAALNSSNIPMSVSELVKKLHVNKTTIYRELASFIEEGSISEVDFSDGQKRYELTPDGHHHHAVCMDCKAVVELEIEPIIKKLEQNVIKQSGFMLRKHQIEFFGVCRDCA